MESFVFAVNAVLPIILIVALGYILKRIGLIKLEIARAMNKLVFRVLLPCMLFLNIYNIESLSSISLDFVFYAIIITFIIFFVATPLVMLITKDGRQRGVLIQSTFRSNYALIGIPLAEALFGVPGVQVATLLSAFIIPTFNILAVICFTVYGSGGKLNIKKILLGIVKNPLIIGVMTGCLFLAIRALFTRWGVDFKFSQLTPIYSVLSQLSRTATPIALLALGAQFEFSAVPALKKQIIFGVTLRGICIPAICIAVAYFLGRFSGAHFAAFVGMFGTPVAVSTVPMAQEMNADTSLAGQLVVWTTLVSAFTIFMLSFILKAIGVFV